MRRRPVVAGAARPAPCRENVSRRLAAVLATAQTASATTSASDRAERPDQQGEQHREDDRAHHADRREPHELTAEPGVDAGRWPRDRLPTDVERHAPRGEPAAAVRHIPARSSIAVPTTSTAGVGVVDPVDGHLVDAQPVVLGEHEQLGVEEPARRPRPAGSSARATSAADGLEAALGVGEAAAQRGAQDAGCSCAR